MEEALRTLLLQSSTLAGLVGERLQWGAREQATALPAVTLNKISGAPFYDDDGETGLDQFRVQVDCWADTMTAAKQVSRAVRGQISGYGSTNDFRYIEIDAERDMREGGANQEAYEYRVSMDFIVLSRSF